MERAVFVYTTYPSVVEAERAGRALVEQRLCACVNILPGMISHYWWEGALERGEEVVMIIKTRSSLAERVSTVVKEMHACNPRDPDRERRPRLSRLAHGRDLTRNESLNSWHRLLIAAGPARWRTVSFRLDVVLTCYGAPCLYLLTEGVAKLFGPPSEREICCVCVSCAATRSSDGLVVRPTPRGK